MPLFIGMIWGAFLRVLPSITAQVLLALGISAVTFTGFSASIDYFKNEAIQNASALPADLLGLLSVLKVGNSVSMVVSAIVGRMLVQGMVNGSFKRWITK